LLKLKNDKVNEGELTRVAKYDDEYVIFKSLKLDDPPIKNIQEVVDNFIMYPT
jgi:hypothetical protein